MNTSKPTHHQRARLNRRVTLELEDFAWEAIAEEAVQAGMTIEEFVAFSVLYYLADIDSGRIARRISMNPYTDLLEVQRARSAARQPADSSQAPGDSIPR